MGQNSANWNNDGNLPQECYFEFRTHMTNMVPFGSLMSRPISKIQDLDKYNSVYLKLLQRSEVIPCNAVYPFHFSLDITVW